MKLLAKFASIALEKAIIQTTLEEQVKELERAQRSLEESMTNYQILFEESPTPLWIEDVSQAMAYLEELQNTGMRDLREYLAKRPEEVDKLASMVQVEAVNRSTLEFLKIKSSAEMGEGLNLVISEEAKKTFIEVMISIFEGKKIFEAETVNRIATGENKRILLRSVLLPEGEKGEKRFWLPALI